LTQILAGALKIERNDLKTRSEDRRKRQKTTNHRPNRRFLKKVGVESRRFRDGYGKSIYEGN
jgi:hypothetical protein